MRMKNIKLKGNKKEMLLLVDQNTKLEKGMCEGEGGGVSKTAIYTRECRVRGSGRDIHRDGRLMRV